MNLNISYATAMILLMVSSTTMTASMYMYNNQISMFIEWMIFFLNSNNFVFMVLMDWMSTSFMSVVTLIAFVVIMYSTKYMKTESTFLKFNILVVMFVMSMMLMILSPNLVSILLGWDGLGLTSYCLVVFYENNKSSSAGMITILSNRIGDIMILMAISWMLNMGSWNLEYLMETSKDQKTIMVMMITMAAMTKSAQLPFSAWLPAAMSAPTPVSSLVHSSTLVTAGVYLMVRVAPLMEKNMFLFYTSVTTMLMAGVCASMEMDLKKVIALSTLSQLSVMMMAVTLKLKDLAFFHLMAHALFKSLLFLCAGMFIHSFMDTQDNRNNNNLSSSLPSVSLFFMSANFSLCGFPFMTGFMSKDFILELMMMNYSTFMSLTLILMATMMTFIYSLRLFWMSLMEFGGTRMKYLEEPLVMVMPMSILFILSLIGGNMLMWTMTPLSFVYMPTPTKLTTIMLGLTSLLIFLKMKKKNNKAPKQAMNLIMEKMWSLGFVSSYKMNKYMKLASELMKFMDQGWNEFLGPKPFMMITMKTSLMVDKINMTKMKTFMLTSIYFMIMMIIMK